jgi:hypothetical protein
MKRLLKILAVIMLVALCVALPLMLLTLVLCLIGVRSMLLINACAVAGITTVVASIAYFIAYVKNDYREWCMSR